ncbi:MAG TPA: hypothetical protein VIV60_10620 [Polyangiaceae bacterium]
MKRDLVGMFTSILAGSVLVVAGVPLFLAGSRQRAKYKRWEASQRQAVTVVPRLTWAGYSAVGLSVLSVF